MRPPINSPDQSSNGNNFLHFRDLFFDNSFNSSLEGKGSHRAAFAGTLQPYFNNVILSDLDEFYVTTVRLNCGSDLIEDFFDFFFVDHIESLVCQADGHGSAIRIEQIEGFAINCGNLGIDYTTVQEPSLSFLVIV